MVARLPANFETPQELVARNKPRLQRSLQDTSAAAFGAVPFTGAAVEQHWLPFLDLYLKLQLEVDGHVGHILRTLERRPAVAANTVIVFTSDHGEYGASHGLRGKGAAVYEEAIRVPLIVKDPRRVLTGAPERTRDQLTSSVDLAPLLLTIATGSDAWRREPYYSHLSGRLELARILADPSVAGREYVLHATDELVTEFATELYAADAPLHIFAIRTRYEKYAVYTDWTANAIDPVSRGQDSELYDYRTQAGRLECATAPATILWRSHSTHDCCAPSKTSCGRRSPRGCSPRGRAESRTTSTRPGRTRSWPRSAAAPSGHPVCTRARSSADATSPRRGRRPRRWLSS